jgi:hypothetical protein
VVSETIDQMRAASEQVAQRIMERVLDLVVQSLDVNELASQIDVDALLKQVDLNAVIEKVDLNALLSRVDVQALAERIDIAAILQHTDVGAVIAMSSGRVTSDAVDVLLSWAAAGRTPGMALLGLRVVRADGGELDPWRGVLRALVFPLSILLCGLGFVGILVQREHRALHDLLAGTAVVYSWDARATRFRFLARTAPRPRPLTPAG